MNVNENKRLQSDIVDVLRDAAMNDPLVYSFLYYYIHGELSHDDCLIGLVKAMAERHKKVMQIAEDRTKNAPGWALVLG